MKNCMAVLGLELATTRLKPDYKFEPPHDKTNKIIYAPSEDSDQPGHPTSLISLRSALDE